MRGWVIVKRFVSTLMICTMLMAAAPAMAANWILWTRRMELKKGTRVWVIMAGYPKYEECEKGLRRYGDPPDYATIKTDKQGQVETTESFICLPDTIDPRK